MSYVVLALGVLLTAAGGLSIYEGSDIIQLERGWTEVIAGTTAVAGGVVTMALGLILRRLKILSDLYATAGQPLQAPSPVAVEPHAAAAPLAASSLPASGLPASILAASSSAPPPPAAIPIPSPEPASAGGLLNIPGALRPPPPRPVPPPAKPFVRPAKPFYPEPEPAKELALASSGAALMEAPQTQPHAAALDTPLDLAPADEGAIPERPRPSPAALSLDEMWKRVTEEIERPIWSPEPPAAGPPAAKAEALPSEPAADLLEPWEEEPKKEQTSARDSAAASESHRIDEPKAETAHEDVDAGSQNASNPDLHQDAGETAPHDAPHPPPLSEAHADETFLQEDESLIFGETPNPEPEAPPPAAAERHLPPPVPPQAAEPAVIGRYEAEGTAYLMFDDGSIEAQSEAGVFRFASMAELKAFIEDRQAVEP